MAFSDYIILNKNHIQQIEIDTEAVDPLLLSKNLQKLILKYSK